jgi:glycosyltransferase involved in cell wall biosynthesis
LEDSHNFLFSVIVPTFNRIDEIKELLESLTKQTIDKNLFEVIIVDDGSTDSTDEFVQDFSLNSPFRISLLKQNHQGPGEARNYGMKKALGKYFVFIDSDCLADKNWLHNYEIEINRNSPIAFGGPDKVLKHFSPVQKAIDYSMTSFITTGGIRGHSKKKISKYYPRSFNMGVRADIVNKIGGMNKLRHGQDIEFSNRIISTGGKVLKVDNAIVYHKRRMSIKKFFRQVFNWGVARINLYLIDSKMLEPVHFLPAIGTLVIALTVALAIFFPTPFLFLVYLGILILFLMAIHGGIKYKDLRVIPLIPIIVPTQIIGYGLGFLIAFIRRIIFHQKEFTGFVKKYY